MGAYEGTVQSRTVQKTPTKRRFDPKTKSEQYRINNEARNCPDPLSSLATFANPLSYKQLIENFANAVIHPDTGELLEYKGLDQLLV